MSQLNVDILTNRSGTAGPTVSGNLTVNGNTSISGNASISGSLSFGQNLNVAGIVTATSFVSPSGGLNISGVTTATRFVSTQATGTAPLTVSSTTVVTNLNADLLDGQQGSFYQDAGNLNAGSIPSARLATGTANIDTFLRGDRTWASITSYSDYGSLEQVSGATRKSIAAIYSAQARNQDPYYAWNTTGPWSTFYTYGGAGQRDAEQGAWFGLGISPNSSYGSFNSYIENRKVKQITVSGDNIGPQGPYDQFYWTSNQYCYAPISVLMMPIRNNSNVSKSITVYGVYSSYWCSGYDGSSAWVYSPAQTGTYSGVTSGTWTQMASLTGSNSSASAWSYNMTIPANTTYVVMSMASFLYYSASSSSIMFFEMNKLYNLSTTFSDPFVQVDSRMINTMRFADWTRYGITSTSSYQFFKVYNACADMYGNR